MDFRYGPLWSETHCQPLQKTTQNTMELYSILLQSKIYTCHNDDCTSYILISDLFERSRSPHQLVHHVDGDPHEG